MRGKIRRDILKVDAAALVPHHHRGALFGLKTSVDLIDVAVCIAEDDEAGLAAYLGDGRLFRPTAAQIADWCVDTAQEFQFIILQPYVLAQELPRVNRPSA